MRRDAACRGTSLIRKWTLPGPYILGPYRSIFLGSYGGPRGVSVFFCAKYPCAVVPPSVKPRRGLQRQLMNEALVDKPYGGQSMQTRVVFYGYPDRIYGKSQGSHGRD